MNRDDADRSGPGAQLRLLNASTGVVHVVAQARYCSRPGYVRAVKGAAALIRLCERTVVFKIAMERASALGQRLVVIGNPDAGLHTRLIRAYGCSDVFVDLNGCPRCPVTVLADSTKGPIPDIADDSAVVFVFCVFEYIAELDTALREVSRIAGSPENLFVVTVQPWTLTARLYPGAHWRGTIELGRLRAERRHGAGQPRGRSSSSAAPSVSCWRLHLGRTGGREQWRTSPPNTPSSSPAQRPGP